MDREKDAEPKKLQVRLPNDEYVKLKYLAAHHGNSMNAEVLVAINLAEREARKTGLSIPAGELSAKAFRENFDSPFREMIENYLPSHSFSGNPEIDVKNRLTDWLKIHAELRTELFSLGLFVESTDQLIRTILKNGYAFEAEKNPGLISNDLQRVLLKTGGFPGLREAYDHYIQQVSRLMPKIKNVERVNEGVAQALQVLRNTRSDKTEEN